MLVLAFLAAACNGCATSHYYAVRMALPVEPISFQVSLDKFLRDEGFRPLKELFANNHQCVADVTGGLPRWDKTFKYSWPNGAGFVSVTLDPPYNPVVLNVGASDNRLHDADQLEGELMIWLRGMYPGMDISERKIRFQIFPW
jgi:hypothetical protein